MEVTSMAAYRSRFQNLQHIAPQPRINWINSLGIWNGHRVLEEQALSDEIQRITLDFDRPRLAVVTGEVIVERDSRYWRRLRHDEINDQRRKGCRCCKGTGEMLVYIDEPAEPCARCQKANPYETYSTDERPF